MDRRTVKARSPKDRWILGCFFLFLLAIAGENQAFMNRQVEAYQNDAYVQRLRETLRREYIAFSYGDPEAPDVRDQRSAMNLEQITRRQALPLPESLILVDGPAGRGELRGLGHPFFGGKSEPTVWRLMPGAPGGGLELEAVPGDCEEGEGATETKQIGEETPTRTVLPRSLET